MPKRLAHLSKSGLTIVVLGFGLSAGLAGCSTSADVSYGEYSYGPGYEAGQVYANRVYGDTQRGFGSEDCRTVLRREVDAYGRASSVEETVCD